MRQQPSQEVYKIGLWALEGMLDPAMTPYGTDMISNEILDLQQAHHGWQLAEAIDAGNMDFYIPVPRVLF